MRSNEVEFSHVEVLAETEKALLCVIDGEEHWIPKSQIGEESEVYDFADHCEGTLVITEWLAKERGLI